MRPVPPRALFSGPLIATLCLVAPALRAEEVVLSGQVRQVTLYPDAARVARAVPLDLAPGDHQLVLPDMPFVDPALLRITTPSGQIGAVRWRDSALPPRTEADSPAIRDARARVKDAKAAVDALETRAKGAEAEAAAAGDRLKVLAGLGQNPAAADPATLPQLLSVVATQSLAARQDQLAAEGRAKALRDGLPPLQKAQEAAEQALAALLTAAGGRARLVVDFSNDSAVQGEMTVSYLTQDAGWQPAYDVSLVTTGASPALEIARKAVIRQASGEDWSDVKLDLSTARPSGQVAPSELWPELLRYGDPRAPMPLARAAGAPVAEMMMKADAVSPNDGLTLDYAYPQPVSLANGAEALTLSLGETRLAPELYARAVPMSDPSAYLMAGFTNEGTEPLLASDQAAFYLDGTYMGTRSLPLLPAGSAADWSFGPIDGLRLERQVVARSEGDRGVIAKSNRREEEVRLVLKNQTRRDWDLRVTDRVPYSEQDDLKITWQADPAPEARDVDGQRGILEWRLPLAAGVEKVITLQDSVSWPEGKVLN
ncbi:DUF4139 domain-containing protein [Pseudooceanicola sp. CBS1P-1]|nr:MULTISPECIES: DUF4139 domain-containing protein [Pseudooceanicola]MBT9384090.1 DUF4139 domain-containing protein [Pseudooceanicola endophyticus]